MTISEYSIVIAGVGGQGGLTLSRIIATAAAYSGLNVRTGETLGMAQRGGSVQSYVKIGRRVYSPLIKKGSADALIGLEPLEAARASPYVGPDTKIVLDPEPVPTIFHIVGRENYPPVEELIEILREKTRNIHIVLARREAEKINAKQSANMILLGKLISIDSILSADKIEEAVRIVLRKNAHKAIEAFRKGMVL
ncbi:MAG: indolepyruvate oxidoreductase subunit beta [Candidatus Caldarchaeales archaeon]